MMQRKRKRATVLSTKGGTELKDRIWLVSVMKALLTFFFNPCKLKLLWVLWDHLINKNIFFGPRLKFCTQTQRSWDFSAPRQLRFYQWTFWRPYRLFWPILLNLSSYGHPTAILWRKNILRPIGAFVLLKLTGAEISQPHGSWDFTDGQYEGPIDFFDQSF